MPFTFGLNLKTNRMKLLETKGSYQTPKMVFDLSNGIIKIIGRSTLLNPQDYYSDAIKLIENYCKTPNKNTILIIDLEHYNTLTARYLLKIITLVSKLRYMPNCEIKINWYYDFDNLGFKDNISLYSEIISFKINAIEHQYA